MEFEVFHKYKTLTRRGLVKPLACQHCDREMSLVLGPEDQPALKCFYCNTLTIPGLAMYDRIKAVVSEHFL